VHQIELETQAEELRKAQIAFEESRDKYLDLYDFAPVGYFTLTDKARITQANLTLATLLLVERRDLISHGFGRFIAQEDLERWDRFFADVRQDVKKQSCTLTLKRGDGTPFPARLDGQRIAGSREKNPTIRVTVNDISDLWMAEEALRENQKTLQAFFNATTDPLVLVAPDGTILAANAITGEAFGAPADTVIGKNAYKLLPPAIVKHRKKIVDRVVKTKKPAEYEDERAGRHLHHYVYPVLGDDGNVRSVAIYARDITERWRMEEALRESEEKYRTLFESMAPGVFYQRSDGTLIDANPAALRMFGLTRGQFTGRDSYDPRWKVVSETGELLAPEQHPSMIALRSGKPVKDLIVGVYNPARDEMTWLSTNAEPQFRSGEATPYQVFVTMYDITERRRAQEALKESEQLLSEVFDNANDAIFLLERTPEGPGKYLLVNDTAIRMLGYAKEELMAMSPKDIVPEDIAKKIMPGVIKKLLRDGYATF
jgi:PAS domain S-box-containing protein